MINYSISKDYTVNPGSRLNTESTFSGEDFRETILKNLVLKAIRINETILIDLDYTNGISYAFLDESIGGLIRKGYFTKKQLLNTLVFKSDEMPSYKNDIRQILSLSRLK